MSKIEERSITVTVACNAMSKAIKMPLNCNDTLQEFVAKDILKYAAKRLGFNLGADYDIDPIKCGSSCTH